MSISTYTSITDLPGFPPPLTLGWCTDKEFPILKPCTQLLRELIEEAPLSYPEDFNTQYEDWATTAYLNTTCPWSPSDRKALMWSIGQTRKPRLSNYNQEADLFHRAAVWEDQVVNVYLDLQHNPDTPQMPPSQDKHKTLSLLPPFAWPTMEYEVLEYAEVCLAWKDTSIPNKRMLNSLLRTHYTTQGPMNAKCPWQAYFLTVMDGGFPALQIIANDMREWLEQRESQPNPDQTQPPSKLLDLTLPRNKPIQLASWKFIMEEWENTTEEDLQEVYHLDPIFDAHFQKWWGRQGTSPDIYLPEQAVQEDNLYQMYKIMKDHNYKVAQSPQGFFSAICDYDFPISQT